MVRLSQLAPLAVSLLISSLAYGSQVLFVYIEPYALDAQQAWIFNVLVLCIWICYARACVIDPGHVPLGWVPDLPEGVSVEKGGDDVTCRGRWCKKCKAFKPPRAHHCKTCQRCIPKMDHHCPWTINCVSHRTLPHFVRFLVYAVASMGYLQYFLFARVMVVWDNRKLPSYLGPTITQLASLFVLFGLNFLTLFAVGVMCLRSLWSVWMNTTTIEGWEMERHQTLLRRSRALGDYLDGPDGIKVRITKQEFPYDIGILSNINQAMGGNILTWFWPFSFTPANESGLAFEVNGFEDASVTWPPPDPDRMPRKPRLYSADAAFTHEGGSESNQERLQAFKYRQERDIERTSGSYRRRPFHERYADDEDDVFKPDSRGKGEESWKNAEGEGLQDFGVDEDAEFYDEDDVPLAQLIGRRDNIGP